MLSKLFLACFVLFICLVPVSSYTDSYASFTLTFYKDSYCTTGSNYVYLYSIDSVSTNSNEKYDGCQYSSNWPGTSYYAQVNIDNTGYYWSESIQLGCSGTGPTYYTTTATNIDSSYYPTCISTTDGATYKSLTIQRTSYHTGYSTVSVTVAGWVGISIAIVVVVFLLVFCMYRRRRAILVTGNAYQQVGVPQPVVGYMPPQPTSYYPAVNQQNMYGQQQPGYQPPVAQAYPAQRV